MSERNLEDRQGPGGRHNLRADAGRGENPRGNGRGGTGRGRSRRGDPQADPPRDPAQGAGRSSGQDPAEQDGRERMLLQWILSRETHSSRAIAAIIAAALLTLLSLYVLLESALKAVGQPSWLASPQDWAGWVAALPAVASTALLGISGVVILLVGLLFFLQAVLPGRRARLVMPSRRAAVVVDAEVLASSLARRARLAAGVRPEQVLVIVSRRQAEVQLRPTSGIPVRPETVQAAVEEELERTGVRPRPQVRVRIAERGVVGQ